MNGPKHFVYHVDFDLNIGKLLPEQVLLIVLPVCLYLKAIDFDRFLRLSQRLQRRDNVAFFTCALSFSIFPAKAITRSSSNNACRSSPSNLSTIDDIPRAHSSITIASTSYLLEWEAAE